MINTKIGTLLKGEMVGDHFEIIQLCGRGSFRKEAQVLKELTENSQDPNISNIPSNGVFYKVLGIRY